MPTNIGQFPKLNVWGSIAGMVKAGIGSFPFSGIPVNGTSGTYAKKAGPGSKLVDTTTGEVYFNIGTLASPVWNKASSIRTVSGTILSADITGTGGQQLGHANGITILAAPGAGKIYEPISLMMFNDFAVAAYGGGGNISVRIAGGGAVLTGLIASTFTTSAVDIAGQINALSPAVPADNAALNIASSGAPTQPGTAAGVFRYIFHYRLHNTGF